MRSALTSLGFARARRPEETGRRHRPISRKRAHHFQVTHLSQGSGRYPRDASFYYLLSRDGLFPVPRPPFFEAAGAPQLRFANLTVAALMLNAFYALRQDVLGYCEVCLDLVQNLSCPVARLG